MRVIAGEARGRPLRAPKGSAIRPTSDRVREAMFNALGSQFDLHGARVVDLFAGSGALGVEALSRGAAEAVFVDHDAAARRVIVENLRTTGFHDRATVRGGDATAPWCGGERFDVAFCDPPYRFDGWHNLLVGLPADWAVLESDREVGVAEGWEIVRSKRYGSTVVVLARRGGPAETVSAEQE